MSAAQGTHAEITSILICGGGTAGWMTAAAMARVLPKDVTISLVESEEIGTVGVGEATIPPILTFNALLGLDEDEFLRACNGTFKLGIEFVNWGARGERYIHPFGTFGTDMQGIRFHQFYFALYQELGRRKTGRAAIGSLTDYSICAQTAYQNRFARPDANAGPVAANFKYAFHFDAGLYAAHLRKYAEKRGVKRLEGKISAANLAPETGHIHSVSLQDGRTLEAELFIDCTGFRGLLIGEALKVPYIDWSRWLPCDRAWAVPSTTIAPLIPYTRSTADAAGWRWRIPLQSRIGNGHVFSSQYMDEDTARERLLEGLDGEALDEPRLIAFKVGHRQRLWEKNCIAIGLSSGFLEPLESTAIQIIQMSIQRLFQFFPDRRFLAAERDEYNSLGLLQFEQVRDFIIAHYKVTRRDDTPFWLWCQNMEVPESLSHKINLFSTKGRLVRRDGDLFAEDNWLAVLHGQGLVPEQTDPLIRSFLHDDIVHNLGNIRKAVASVAQKLPLHEAYIQRFCQAPIQESCDVS